MEGSSFPRGQGPCDTDAAIDTKATGNHDLNLPIIRWVRLARFPYVYRPVVGGDTDGALGPRVGFYNYSTISLGGGNVGAVVGRDQRHSEALFSLQDGVLFGSQCYGFGCFSLCIKSQHFVRFILL